MTNETKNIIIKTLSDRLEMLYHNLECYSQDFLMKRPKLEFSEKHYVTKLEIEKVEKALKEVNAI